MMTQRWHKTYLALVFSLILVAISGCGSEQSNPQSNFKNSVLELNTHLNKDSDIWNRLNDSAQNQRAYEEIKKVEKQLVSLESFIDELAKLVLVNMPEIETLEDIRIINNQIKSLESIKSEIETLSANLNEIQDELPTLSGEGVAEVDEGVNLGEPRQNQIYNELKTKIISSVEQIDQESKNFIEDNQKFSENQNNQSLTSIFQPVEFFVFLYASTLSGIIFLMLLREKDREQSRHETLEIKTNEIKLMLERLRSNPELTKTLINSYHHGYSHSGVDQGFINSLREKISDLEQRVHVIELRINMPADTTHTSIKKDDHLSQENFNTLEWLKEYNDPNFRSDKNKVILFSKKHNVKEVSQTEISINQQRLGQQGAITFETNTSTGNYWLIRSLSSRQNIQIFYMVPNKERFRFQSGSFKAVQASFKLQQAGADDSQEFDPAEVKDMSQFEVIYPAEVTEVSAGQEWRLNKKGLLKF